MNMKRTLLLCTALFLVGCTSAVQPTIRDINTLAPGVIQVRRVGEPMLEKGVIKALPGFVARTNAYLPSMERLIFPPIKKGDILECPKRLDNGDFLCAKPGMLPTDVLNDAGDPCPQLPLFVFKPWGEFRGLYLPWLNQMSEQPNRLKGVFTATEIPLKETHKKELIYDGKTDDVIKLTYLEFAEDFTQPTLFQGLSYDTASLNVINVKDIKIEVIEATESSIKFMVKKN
jgi:hypothetical protein